MLQEDVECVGGDTMGWDIDLVNEDGKPVEVPSHTVGSNYIIGGRVEASMLVTYNYSDHYRACLDSEKRLMCLHEKKAKDTIKQLEIAIRLLGTNRDKDYWKPTPGNAGYILSVLLGWAKLHPEAVWKVYP